MNIVSNFIPHETVICNDRDPPWINSRIANLIIKKKKKNYKKYLCSRKNTKVFEKFKLLQNEIINLQIKVIDIIQEYRNTERSNKLNVSHVSPKTYWSILKNVFE